MNYYEKQSRILRREAPILRPKGGSRMPLQPRLSGTEGRHGGRRQQFPGFGDANPEGAKRQGCRFAPAQGIEAVSFFATGKKDTSG
jgi:hypothetical protein